MKLLSITEGVASDVSKLKSFGFEITDSFSFHPYTILLIYDANDDLYQLALSSNDQEFLTFQSQVKQPQQSAGIPVSSFKALVSKLKDWLDSYGNLMAGSFNKDRAYKYHKLLTKLGFNLDEVSYAEKEEHHEIPESWNFTIYK